MFAFFVCLFFLSYNFAFAFLNNLLPQGGGRKRKERIISLFLYFISSESLALNENVLAITIPSKYGISENRFF